MSRSIRGKATEMEVEGISLCNPITARYPDRLLDQGEHMGYKWLVAGNHMGFRCGYICVPEGHPWHGKDYDDLYYVEVHGGLTFSVAGVGDGCTDWWLGFDCAHAGDAPDPELPGYQAYQFWPGDCVRTQDYVVSECEALCEQAWRAGGRVL